MTSLAELAREYEAVLKRDHPQGLGVVLSPVPATARVYWRSGLTVTLFTRHQSRPFASFAWHVQDDAGRVLDSGWAREAEWAEATANASADALGQAEGFKVETDS